jgi:hypothetical protein
MILAQAFLGHFARRQPRVLPARIHHTLQKNTIEMLKYTVK